MTPPATNDRDTPEREALQWLIALREAPQDAALRGRLKAWLEASSAHRAAWQEARRTWDLLAAAGPAQASAPRRARMRFTALHGRKRRWRAVASAALAACLLAYLVPVLSLQLEADFVTAAGADEMVVLPDGSRLHLDAGSAVAVDYGAGARRVRLLAGAVFAEVVPDAARPFSVVAQSVESSALGTAFEVRRAESGTFVAVARGVVGAEDPGTALSERLEAGDWLHVERSGAARRGTAGEDQVAAWRHGRLAVNDWPLGDVVDALRRHFRGSIVMLNDGLAARRVTGFYDLADPAAALRAAVYPYGARVHRLTPWVLVVSGS